MRPVSVVTHVSASREEIFDFLVDLSQRPATADHYLDDYRLARANPVGRGAAARFLLDGPFFAERGDFAITTADRPRKLVEEGSLGLRGRSRLVAVWDLSTEPGRTTRVELTTFADPKTIIDRVRHVGAHGWMRRKTGKSLERLRRLFEEPEEGDRPRVAVAGFEPGKAPRFGARASGGEKARSGGG